MLLAFSLVILKLAAVLAGDYFFLKWLFNQAAIDASEQTPDEKKSFADIVLVRINDNALAAGVFYAGCVLSVGIVSAAAIFISV